MKTTATATWSTNCTCTRRFSFERLMMIACLFLIDMQTINSYGQISGYCIPAQSQIYPSAYKISNITLTEGITNFTNTTGNETASYGDYSSTKVASQVQNYPLTITATSAGDAMNYKVYVDYNDNGVFTDEGELVLSLYRCCTPGTVSGIFIIPGTAPVGTHRMRVKGQYYGVTQTGGPCSQLYDGETEDYGLTVLAGCAQPTIQGTMGSFANDASFETTTINWTRGNGTGGVLVVGRLTSAVLSVPTGGVAYTANPIFGSGSQIGDGNFVVYNGTGTSVDVTGLTQGAGYTFTCYEYDNTGICYRFPGSSLEVYSGYCVPPASTYNPYNNANIYIKNVQVTGAVTNFTNATGLGLNSYSNYSSTKIASQVQNFPITISATSNVSGMKNNVYVDYNDNGVFTDPGELVVQMESVCACSPSGSFTIPATAPPGTHRMRVRADDKSIGYPAGPCTQLEYGETEDYALTVIAACTQPTTQAVIGTYTNIFAGTDITVNWTRGNGTGGVLVVGRLSSSELAEPKERASYTANTIFGSGTQIGAGNFVVYNGTGTSVDVTGLTGGASYTFTCYEYDITSTCFKTPGSGSAVVTGGYCTPAQSIWYTGSARFISNVNTTGGITNFTNSTLIETASYGFYASTKIVSQAQSSPVTVNATNGGFGTLGMDYNVYIDYNDNGVFTDSGELVLQMGSASMGIASGSFSIPADAPLGTHRMRIRAESFGSGYPTDPCNQMQYGETEDYALTVTAGCNPPTTQATIASYTNMISSGKAVTVNWTRGNGTAGVLVVGRLTSSAPTDPTGGVSYNADAVFGNGSQIGTGNFVVYNGTGTSVNVNGLSPTTSYSFICYEYDAAATCYKTPGSGSTFVTGGYCEPAQSVYYSYGMAITNVTTTGAVTNFTNITGVETASYGDYSSTHIASQAQGSPLTINTTSNPYGLYYNVYVDYNDNNTFTDPGELVLQMGNIYPGDLSGSFTIPVTAPLGTHRMRVKADFYNAGYPTNPCTQLQFGETEDYGVTVTAPCTQPTAQATIGSYTNNTTGNSIKVNWTRGNGTGGVLVVGRLTSSALTNPTGGVPYTANVVFGSGTQIGPGNFVVYNGTGTSVTVSGLSQSAGYTFTVYEYDNPSTCYKVPGSASAVTTFTLPLTYFSSNTIQLNNGVMLYPSSVDNQIVQVQVVTTGGTSPFSMTSMVFSTSGSANAPTDIANAKVYYTGTSSVFATTTQFGSTFNNPNSSFTINGNQVLTTGINYFWLVYDLTATPTPLHAIDACCTQLVMSGSGGTRTPATTCPTGNAFVNIIYCIPQPSAAYPYDVTYIDYIATTGGVTNFFSYPEASFTDSYINYSADVVASQVQNLPITINVVDQWGMNYKVYVDYNDNGVFTDAGEMVLAMTSVVENGGASGSFTIPADAPPGTHRMRVRSDLFGIAGPCNQLGYGETNDYGLTVLAPPVQYYVDADHDGYGSTETAVLYSSTAPDGYATNNTDCNDNNSAINPAAVEICGDGIDNNCNGQVDEGCAPLITVTATKTAASSCLDDGTITLSKTGGTAPFTYSLNGASYKVGAKFTGLAAGTYTGYVKDANNNIGMLSGIMVVKIAAVVVSASTVAASSCMDDGVITLRKTGGKGPFTYSLDGVNFVTTNKFTGLVAGTYTGYVKDAKCPAASLAGIQVLKKATLVVKASKTNTTGCVDDGTITLRRTGGTAPFTYSLDGVNYVTTNVFTGLAAGSYSGYVKDAKCPAASLAGIIISTSCSSLSSLSTSGGNNASIKAGNPSILIFPNPVNNLLNVELRGYSGDVTLQLINIEGKTLRQEQLQTVSEKFAEQKINVSDLASGIYFLTVIDEHGNRKTEKVIVAH